MCIAKQSDNTHQALIITELTAVFFDMKILTYAVKCQRKHLSRLDFYCRLMYIFIYI